jgi:hypothetical protein
LKTITVQPDGLAVGEAVAVGLVAVVAVWVGLAVGVGVGLEVGVGVTVGRGLALPELDQAVLVTCTSVAEAGRARHTPAPSAAIKPATSQAIGFDCLIRATRSRFVRSVIANPCPAEDHGGAR